MTVEMESHHDGEFWCARGLGESVFTQGATFDELVDNIKEAVALHFEEADTLPEVLLLSDSARDESR